jgi:pyruvate dehydrogenase E2 component (dihydrolipoamide acetyltransferase)
MRFEFKLPDIGEGMVEGEIVKWHVNVGDDIQEDAPMVDVMTDKATVTIPSPKSGKVLELRGKEGEVVKVGSVLVVIETTASSVEAPLSSDSENKTQVSAPVKPNGGSTTASEVSLTGGRVLASPATRRLARELGVDLSHVSGSGPGGRITEQDVRLFLEKKATPIAVASPALVQGKDIVASSLLFEKEERIPLRGLRRKISEKMTLSKKHAPHFTYVEEMDATELVALRDKADSLASQKGIKLTYLPFIVKAVVQALKEFPMLNSVLDEEKQEIVLKRYYHIGIAAATSEGLTVPVLKNADQKTILHLAKEINELAEKARAGKLSLEEVHGSTFTITSLGPLGGIFATPIINYPEVAILGVHRIHDRPVVRDGQIVSRKMMYLSLSFDHRVVDGDVGARFANRIIELLQQPALMLLE